MNTLSLEKYLFFLFTRWPPFIIETSPMSSVLSTFVPSNFSTLLNESKWVIQSEFESRQTNILGKRIENAIRLIYLSFNKLFVNFNFSSSSYVDLSLGSGRGRSEVKRSVEWPTGRAKSRQSVRTSGSDLVLHGSPERDKKRKSEIKSSRVWTL